MAESSSNPSTPEGSTSASAARSERHNPPSRSPDGSTGTKPASARPSRSRSRSAASCAAASASPRSSCCNPGDRSPIDDGPISNMCSSLLGIGHRCKAVVAPRSTLGATARRARHPLHTPTGGALPSRRLRPTRLPARPPRTDLGSHTRSLRHPQVHLGRRRRPEDRHRGPAGGSTGARPNATHAAPRRSRSYPHRAASDTRSPTAPRTPLVAAARHGHARQALHTSATTRSARDRARNHRARNHRARADGQRAGEANVDGLRAPEPTGPEVAQLRNASATILMAGRLEWSRATDENSRHRNGRSALGLPHPARAVITTGRNPDQHADAGKPLHDPSELRRLAGSGPSPNQTSVPHPCSPDDTARMGRCSPIARSSAAAPVTCVTARLSRRA